MEARFVGFDVLVQLDVLTSKLKNFAPVMKQFAKWVNQVTIQNFNESHDINGRAFAKLKPSTLKRKQRLGQPSTPLIASGESVGWVHAMPDNKGFTLSASGNIRPSISGTKHMAQRNPTVFTNLGNLRPVARDKLYEMINAWIAAKQ